MCRALIRGVLVGLFALAVIPVMQPRQAKADELDDLKAQCRQEALKKKIPVETRQEFISECAQKRLQQKQKSGQKKAAPQQAGAN